jgi:hypothetical protein
LQAQAKQSRGTSRTFDFLDRRVASLLAMTVLSESSAL